MFRQRQITRVRSKLIGLDCIVPLASQPFRHTAADASVD